MLDKEELENLCKKLGHDLSKENVKTAMADLDLDGSGYIDMDEFARWYMSGFNSYGPFKKSMLMIRGNAVKILEKTKH